METADHTGKAAPAARTTDPARGEPAVVASEHPFGPNAASILATEDWSLFAARALIWNETMSRATFFLTVLSASIIALALLAGAAGSGPQTATLALVLLPIVLLLGIATYVGLVQINTEEFQLVLAMNRLRRAYLTIAPALEPYFTTGHHDDERGLVTTYMLHRPTQARLWLHFLVNTPTIVATVDAALATAMFVLVMQVAQASRAALVVGGVLAFLAVWGTLSSPAAPRSAPAPRYDAQVPLSAGCTLIALAAHADPEHRWRACARPWLDFQAPVPVVDLGSG
jgi:hypothetical protein